MVHPACSSDISCCDSDHYPNLKENKNEDFIQINAHLQTMTKTLLECQKDLPTAVRGVVHTQYLLCIQFDSIGAKDKLLSKNENEIYIYINTFRITPISHAHLQTTVKTLTKFQKRLA